MNGSLDALVTAWAAAYGVTSAWETGGGACASALRARGVTVDPAPESGDARDMVIVHDVTRGSDWAARATALAKLASKLVVVTAANTRRRGATRIEELAPLLWTIGRVKERELYDFPLPALARAPRALRARVARSEAFAIDVSPRTPQARRRRRLIAT
jgi:hypothetical protein